MSRDLFDALDVSRETSERLAIYLNLLEKWSPKINLVAKGTLPDALTRHFQDSLQLIDLAPVRPATWLDLGSGGGFPGLVIALVLAETEPTTRVGMIEADVRKATFLRTVLRETGVVADIYAKRIEDAPGQRANVVSARALAPLPKLLGYVHRHMASEGTALLPKGENAQKEVDAALLDWKFRWTAHTSKTNKNAVILEIGELDHV